jgi:hypothetical protein
MVGFVLENTLIEHGHVARGVCKVDQDGYLLEVHERTRIERSGGATKYTEDGENWMTIPPGSTASMNAWGFTPSLFDEMSARFPWSLEENGDSILRAEFFLPEIVGDLIKEGRARVKVQPTQERWLWVTYRQDRPQLQHAIADLIRQGIYPENLWGV